MVLFSYINIINLIILVILLYFVFNLSNKIDILTSDKTSKSSITTISPKIRKTKIEILNDEKYYYYVLNLISSAKKEINIIMFSVYKCKKTEDILYELINARKRGVMVRVILDGEVESNRTIKHLLSSERIPVKLTERQRTHNKLIIVDNETVVLGSHNWTDKALFENRESSVAIIDKKIVNKEKDYFELVWGSVK
ncbi:phospholipase D-like domain-containing protein [Methanothermococcus okinawensis]|uniref:Phospholipase D/Transphosphatidylase n=1 Tax=Methanothermococcus okinawensis (strain DSM 14208 / JCM 11175 / IH1) TaxID=647113 RepID=F8AKW6_METOI|nr:phospholipase D/Transphosphatidylase [Methanothermococcus okinawensis IH1]